MVHQSWGIEGVTISISLQWKRHYRAAVAARMSATSPVLDASMRKTRSWFAAMVDASASSVPVTMERFIIWEMASFISPGGEAHHAQGAHSLGDLGRGKGRGRAELLRNLGHGRHCTGARPRHGRDPAHLVVEVGEYRRGGRQGRYQGTPDRLEVLTDREGFLCKLYNLPS